MTGRAGSGLAGDLSICGGRSTWIMARGLRGGHHIALFWTFFGLLFTDADGQDATNGFSLSPPYFNLAQGSSISASATCGQDESGAPTYDLYCKLVGGPTSAHPQNFQGQNCDYCTSGDPGKAHPVTNAVDGTERWWQSPPLSRGLVYNEVNVTLDLGQLFHVAYVLIKFANSPRPDMWVLEHSVDYGRTYTPWQYFAHSKRECIERFGKEPNARVVGDDDQLCTTDYSRIVPLENGEIVVSLVNGRPGSRNFTYSPLLRDFTKATNIRLHFLRTNTLLGHLISKAQRDPTVTRRYYYSIKDISVGGRCVCHGHAQVCGGGRNQDNPNRLQCECQHNTCGDSCDRCCPGFNQKPWRAATVDSPNECQPCHCFSHAVDCHYDPEVERTRASLDTYGRYDGGGVCINCQHNTAGVNCEKCREGFFRPYGVPPESSTGCVQCRCDESVTAGCEMGSGRCICKQQFDGENCDRCAAGYYHYPQCIAYPVYQRTTTPAGPIIACPPGYFGSSSCQPCPCDSRGTEDPVCDPSGRCLCRQGVEGQSCDRCRPGHQSFPTCQACLCDGAGASNSVCSPSGQCTCFPNFQGQDCDQCAAGYYGYPDCAACQCSSEGSYGSACNPLSGQCLCLPGVVGQQCDRCASGLRFPYCSAPITQCNPAGTESSDPQSGSCRCLLNTEGKLCDRCKPLYWNLAPENPRGCTECRCDLRGTVSGVGECDQKSGQCHCKPNICSQSCDSCSDGYYLLQKKNYFGCQGCQCDIGGAFSKSCEAVSGQCWCRKNTIGPKCTEPAPGFYFPTLHQFKYEVEDGTSPNSRPVRFGYDPQEFPDFSWRGYAVLSPAQSEVRVSVHVDPKEGTDRLFRVVLRFTNPSGTSVTGTVNVTNNRGGSEQSKEVVFPESPAPSFLTVPGEGFTEPFVLTPGKWVIQIRAPGTLLDYLVLLPQDYYEAPLLQEKITEPCTYLRNADQNTNCLLYKHVAMDGFSSALASQGRLTRPRGRKRRQARVRRLTPEHPEMAAVSGRQLELGLRVPHSGPYVFVLEYASEADSVQNVNVLVNDQSGSQIQTRASIYSCAYSFLCRSVAVDSANQVAVVKLTHKTELLLMTSTTSFFLYKVYAVPAEEFSLEYVKPKPLCVSLHGRFTEDSQHCILSRFNKPSTANILYAARDGLISSAPAVAPQIGENESWRHKRQTGLFSGFEPERDEILLKFPQTEITFTTKVPLPGRYVVVVHYRQPEHVSFPVEVQVDAGHKWKGSINASFCPSVSGCRDVVVADGRVALDFNQQTWRPPHITATVPPRKTLILDYILVIPESTYTPELLKAKPLNKSAVFTQQCRHEGFYTDHTSSQFCKDAARSLVAAYNDGALPCDCDKSGSTGSACDPLGGQCVCRQHVIGRQCTKCATGYFGFPYCRSCNCGTRLCDEVTGRCICPPQTVKPACDVCQNETFSYHPLLGCEGCDCSKQGINAGLNCNRVTGQCSCKPNISGRQCDRCAPGFFRFPDCVPCNCNLSGVGPDVCHPDTGRCLCKKNVAGKRCGVCREGSFFFDPNNPHGCTGCFCFGATDRCQSSRKRRGKFVDMRGWRLESPDQQEVPSVLNTASNTVVADIQELPPTIQALHWVAPSSYLGDRVSSYGGFLTYQSKSFGIPSEGMTLIDRSADVLMTGHEMSLIHVSPQVHAPDRVYQGRVPLVEGTWRHAGTNRPVSREELLKVLAGLEGLRIRGLYFTQTQRLSLGEVGLEEATDAGTGGPASNVETCACPPHYNGDSCQKCAPGHFRNASATYLSRRCVPCDCNGLADECEETTGKCLNCRYNSAGDKCERCKEGYYGNAAQRTCKVCPCPFAVPKNSFAIGCREVYGDIHCVCRAGYTGDRCERCAPGYYGDPLIPNGRCNLCNCIGNGNSCDPRTGVCNNTMEPGDTNTDESCQECDNCAQTLLQDLEKLDNELKKIKSLLENASVSSLSKERLKELENALADTTSLVKKYGTSMNNQKNRVGQLEEDMSNLSDDISSLKNKAQRTVDDADKAVVDIDKTHKRAKDLESDIQAMLKKIKDLLALIKDGGSGNNNLPSDSLEKMLQDANRMVKEMEKRDFGPQKAAVEKENDEAEKLLDFIKTNVTKKVGENEAEVRRLRDLLKNYDGKLKELDKALKSSSDLLKKANTQNGLNGQALMDLQKRVDDLKKKKKTLEGQMVMATDELRKMEDLLRKLTQSKMEYEQLAAQLDGAKTDATKKANELTKAADKEDLVEAAEEHARKLKKLADDLENDIRDASSRPEVRNAKDAIDAYKNITEAIRAAEQAANEAKDAAEKALNNFKKQKLPERAGDLKNSADDLLENAMDAKDQLNVAAQDINDIKQRLKDADKKKRDLENNFADLQNQFNSINRDDLSDLIDEAKRQAAAANDSASKTMDKLRDIENELDKIKVVPGGADLSGVLADVNKSVKNLLKNIPSLNDKISEVEELTRTSNLGNITDNIKKIKELIEHARDAADKVAVPMKFAGDGHVELRAPKSLEDLKAYTTMALSLQRPQGRGDGRRRRRQTRENSDMFVMYLGNKDSSKDYIGMVLKNNVLHGVYKLNGVEYQMKTSGITRSASELATFDTVNLQRMYQDASLTLTKVSKTTVPPVTASVKGEQSKNLLDLSLDDFVFYVGGYPDNFTPPPSLRFPKYTGCIEFASFNDRAASMYNFKTAVNINPEVPCSRNIPPVDVSFYEGTGYGRVSIGNGGVNNLYMTMTVRSRSENGLLLYVGNEEKYLTVTIERGVVYLRSNFISDPVVGKAKVFPSDNFNNIVFFLASNGMITVRVANQDVASAKSAVRPDDFKEYFIGGVPTEARERYNITTAPFKGCVINAKLNGNAHKVEDPVGISKGCPEEALVSRKAEFSRGSTLSGELPGFSLESDVTLSLGFKSTDSDGLILQNKQQANGVQLDLNNGHVGLAFNNKKWKSNQQYNDGLWHYLTVTKRGQKVEMMIDDQDKGQEQPGSTSITPAGNYLYLGKNQFKGCVTNLYTRRPENLYKPEDLSTFASDGPVLLDMCTDDSPAQLMLDRKPKER